MQEEQSAVRNGLDAGFPGSCSCDRIQRISDRCPGWGGGADSGTWVPDQWKHLQCHRYSVSVAGGHAFAGFAENIGMRSVTEAGECVLLCFPGSLANYVFFFCRRIPALSRNDGR